VLCIVFLFFELSICYTHFSRIHKGRFGLSLVSCMLLFITDSYAREVIYQARFPLLLKRNPLMEPTHATPSFPNADTTPTLSRIKHKLKSHPKIPSSCLQTPVIIPQEGSSSYSDFISCALSTSFAAAISGLVIRLSPNVSSPSAVSAADDDELLLNGFFTASTSFSDVDLWSAPPSIALEVDVGVRVEVEGGGETGSVIALL
jgi:hypothetical protein